MTLIGRIVDDYFASERVTRSHPLTKLPPRDLQSLALAFRSLSTLGMTVQFVGYLPVANVCALFQVFCTTGAGWLLLISFEFKITLTIQKPLW